MPICDFEVIDPNRKPINFMDLPQRDIRLLTNNSGVQKIKRKFDLLPYNFNFYIVPHRKTILLNCSEIDENDDKKIEVIEKLLDRKIILENRITFVAYGNISNPPDLHTHWILLHRFGHAISCSHSLELKDRLPNFMESQFMEAVRYDIFENFILNIKQLFPENNFINQLKIQKLNVLMGFFHMILTMKSARDNMLKTELDIFPELLSQYAFTKKITFNKVQDWNFDRFYNFVHAVKICNGKRQVFKTTRYQDKEDTELQHEDETRQMLRLCLENKEHINKSLEELKFQIIKIIENSLNKSVGKIFIL